MNGPQYRTAQAPKKKALLVSSCAAPGILGRWFFGTDKQLKMTAKTIGAEVVGTLFTGMIAKKIKPETSGKCADEDQDFVGKTGLSGKRE